LNQASPLRALPDPVDADIKVIRRDRLGLAVTAARERTIPDGPGDAESVDTATASQKGTHQLWTTSPAADPKVWFGRRT
jgi:hypothetical protein